ncbi:MAG: hypothetical protein U1E76_14945 [Planctomycetota bacterium]
MKHLALLGGALLAQDVPLPGGAIARVNGEVVSASEYGEWLQRAHGWQFVDEFLTLKVLRQEAVKRGVHITEQDLARAADEDWNNNVRMRFGGREASFLAELKAGGIDRQGYRLRRLPALEVELLANRLLLLTRADDERVLRQLHEIEFGKRARRTHLRVAFFDKFKDLDPARNQQPGVLRELDVRVQERAEQFLARARAGDTSFAALVGELSDADYIPRIDGWVDDLKESGGDLPRYQETLFGGALEARPARRAQAGRSDRADRHRQGAYVVQFLASEPAPFEQAIAELQAINRTRRATRARSTTSCSSCIGTDRGARRATEHAR